MNDNRKASRWHPIENFKSDFVYGGVNDAVEILDISAVGMRAFFSNPVAVGSEVYGKLNIPYNTVPFFVRGKVMRVRQARQSWEAAVEFFKVSTAPLVDKTLS